MLRALESPERAHTLLVGPPACTKSLSMLEKERLLGTKVYFAEGASTTKAGLQRFIAENPHKELSLLMKLTKCQCSINKNVVIFATSNMTELLSKPLLSRFTVFEIPSCTYEQFEWIALRIVKKLHPNIVIQISSSVWKMGSRNIRGVLKNAKLCKPVDGEEDVARLISIHQKYHKTGRQYNWWHSNLHHISYHTDYMPMYGLTWLSKTNKSNYHRRC